MEKRYDTCNPLSLKDNQRTVEKHDEELQRLLRQLEDVHNQVTSSAHTARRDIEDAFDKLFNSLMETVKNRKHKLLKQVKKTEDGALGPLNELKNNVVSQLKVTSDILELGKKIQCDIDTAVLPDPLLVEYNKKLTAMGMSIPEVPMLANVPCISVQFDRTTLKQILGMASGLGRVGPKATVQIVECKAQPGSLALRWEENEMSFGSEHRLFRLQRSLGSVNDRLANPNFEDVYVGPELCHIVRDLHPNIEYSFRICKTRHQDTVNDNEWSVPYVANTSVLPYEWEEQSHYSLDVKKRVATKISDKPCVLYSSGPQFQCKHSMQFRILETCSSSYSEGLGLSLTSAGDDNTICPGRILVNMDGCVFVDGSEMTTRLPNLHKNSVLSFESEELPMNKMRVTISSEDKQVTYDWKLGHTDVMQHRNGVYFFAFYEQSGWKVLVE